ncbi:unnamed protein product [Prorocentrum cordatum]|uniref:Uncharacterized protein n=1 Tax=Prorocentrum cordatum TaxID=2364126 RepID=A0ABN9SMC0_9DINO|nr:unnamed protein product [Polarella glacialis]
MGMAAPGRIRGKSKAGDAGEGWACLAAEQREPRELTDAGIVDAPEAPSGDEGHAAVRTELSDCLEKEVKGIAAGVSLLRPERDSESKCAFACGLCPFRSFSTQLLLRARVSKCRVRETRFVASGAKQFDVVRAPFDNDWLLRAPPGDFLKRSATTTRETVSPAVHRGQNAVDQDVVLVLDDDGPSYQNKAAVGRSLAHRRVGCTYYTRGFADVLMQESLRHHGRVRPAMLRACARVVEPGSELSSMLPTRVDHWLKLMEDVFNSARVEKRSAALMEECRKHEDFLHVSMGASIRILRRVKGLWSEARRSQTVSVASDQPSSVLYRALRSSCFSNLVYLSLDPVHLPIAYEETHWRKKTVGSKLLRIIVAKFTKVSSALLAQFWGAPFDGTNAPSLRPIEERARQQMLDHSLSKSRVQSVIDNVSAELPWRTTRDFIESIAALSALVPEELARRTHVNNVQLKRRASQQHLRARVREDTCCGYGSKKLFLGGKCDRARADAAALAGPNRSASSATVGPDELAAVRMAVDGLLAATGALQAQPEVAQAVDAIECMVGRAPAAQVPVVAQAPPPTAPAADPAATPAVPLGPRSDVVLPQAPH